MRRILHFYKIYKRLSKVAFLWGGLVSLSGLVLLIFFRTNTLLQGISFPLILLGSIQMGGSFRDYFSADGRVRFIRRINFPNYKDLNISEKNYANEVLTGAQKSRKAKLSLVFFGISLSLLSVFSSWSLFSLGMGLGISFQSAPMLVFNLLKEYQLSAFRQTS